MPKFEKPPLLVGSGRLARHLSFYFKNTFIPYLSWSRKSNSPITPLLKDVDVVLLAISDSALSEFYQKNLKDFRGTVLHFSGAFYDENMKSCHPLMSFSNDLMTPDLYPKIYFAESEVGLFKQVFPHWHNPHFYLKNENKALYHACAVLLAAGTQSLWTKAMEPLIKMGVPDSAVELYLKRVTEQFLLSKSAAMTGPWIRGDDITINKNLKALEASQLSTLYQELMRGIYEYS